jgi:hypothetical protein
MKTLEKIVTIAKETKTRAVTIAKAVKIQVEVMERSPNKKQSLLFFHLLCHGVLRFHEKLLQKPKPACVCEFPFYHLWMHWIRIIKRK